MGICMIWCNMSENVKIWVWVGDLGRNCIAGCWETLERRLRETLEK